MTCYQLYEGTGTYGCIGRRRHNMDDIDIATVERAWTVRQCREFARQLRSSIGDGWRWLTADVREALIAQKVLLIALGQDRDTILVDHLRQLLIDVTAAMQPKEPTK